MSTARPHGGRPASLPAALQTTTDDDDRRQQKFSYELISNNDLLLIDS